MLNDRGAFLVFCFRNYTFLERHWKKMAEVVGFRGSRTLLMPHGDLHGIATTTYQSGSHRPTPDLGQYRAPGVDRLYLVGPFQHPGGGVFGAGRATAMVAAEDLGIDFDEIRVVS